VEARENFMLGIQSVLCGSDEVIDEEMLVLGRAAV
jgi:hypothetical protein